MEAGEPVLVTGSAGLIGGALLRRLIDAGVRIRATYHRTPPAVHDPAIEYVQADLCRAEDCRAAVDGMRYVYMCAASTSGAAVMERTPLAHVTPNVLMNTLMLEAAHAAGVAKFLWLSSTTGYPVTGDRPVREEEMFDGHPYEKYYFVGWMKRFTETLCEMYGQRIARPMTTIVLRPTNVYGPGDDFDPATSHVTAALIRKVVERRRPVQVWGTGEDVRDLLYVDDMVEAMIRAMRLLDGHQTINVGLGKGHSVKEVLQLILEIDGYAGAPVEFAPAAPTMIPVRLVDVTRAERLIGFRASVGLPEGLARTIEWYRARQNQER